MTNKYLVLDIGGSFIKSALADGSGGLEDKRTAPAPVSYGDLLRTAAELAASGPAAVICAVPGVYDKSCDKMLFAPNLPYLIEKELAADLSDVAKAPVYVENDANLAALGEYYYGFDKRPQSMVFLTLGTGVGGGAILKGELFTGRYTLFEPGHTTLVAEGRLCGCGKRGCLEKYCTTSAILADYAEASGDTRSVTVRDVAAKLEEGDFAAFAAFDLFALHLSHGIANMINTFTPESLRIGGGLSELAPYYMPRVEELLPGLIFPAFRGITRVETARLKNDAALLGGPKLHEILQ